jgi:hypothetical protein
MVLLGLSRLYYLEIDHDRPLPNPYLFTIRKLESYSMRCYAVETSILQSYATSGKRYRFCLGSY